MACQDKGLLMLNGKTLTEIKIDSLAPQVGNLFISANRNLPTYARLGYPVITDTRTDYPGPLAGIAATLQACASDWLISCPCDTPAVCADYVARMWQARQATDARVVVAHDGERRQNTFLLLHKSLLPAMVDALAHKQHAIYKWLQGVNPAQADFSDQSDMFVNFNTAEALENHADK